MYLIRMLRLYLYAGLARLGSNWAAKKLIDIYLSISKKEGDEDVSVVAFMLLVKLRNRGNVVNALLEREINELDRGEKENLDKIDTLWDSIDDYNERDC